jgi:hypothetical protein
MTNGAGSLRFAVIEPHRSKRNHAVARLTRIAGRHVLWRLAGRALTVVAERTRRTRLRVIKSDPRNAGPILRGVTGLASLGRGNVQRVLPDSVLRIVTGHARFGHLTMIDVGLLPTLRNVAIRTNIS